jgi:hypothetical protein
MRDIYQHILVHQHRQGVCKKSCQRGHVDTNRPRGHKGAAGRDTLAFIAIDNQTIPHRTTSHNIRFGGGF